MILALTATIAIVVLDHTSLRAAPSSAATELTALRPGDVVEIRGERAGYLKVYDYHRERGGYLRSESVRPTALTEAAAPELLTVLRFLRETPGSETLGISYGAAYLKAAPARALTAEPFDAIARMAERLADEASASSSRSTDAAAHLEVVEQFGIRMKSFERNGRMQVCYDGELFRRVLTMGGAGPEERAHALLGLTRPDCIDPALGPAPRAALDDARRELLDEIKDADLPPLMRTRLHLRRAGVWASVAYEQARRGEPSGTAAGRALAELMAADPNELGEDRRSEYVDAVVRTGAVRWAAATAAPAAGGLTVSAAPGDPGQTCVTLGESQHPHAAPLVRRCTYGIVWTASAHAIPQGPALVLAVQPLESWRELWVFHEDAGNWTVDVLSPGLDDPEEGYVDYAGFVPGSKRLLIAREVKEHGRFRRRFEELRLGDLALLRQASSPELLRDFGRWQDVAWRRDTLALH
jgi:hypothetical protein